MGAWIEITKFLIFYNLPLGVASYIGAWIEISPLILALHQRYDVASYMGAWIEIARFQPFNYFIDCRILYGCVD